MVVVSFELYSSTKYLLYQNQLYVGSTTVVVTFEFHAKNDYSIFLSPARYILFR